LRIARNIILPLLMFSSFWLLAGCQSGTFPQTTTGEPAFELNVDILGRMHAISLDDEGRLTVSATLASPDGTIILSIDKGTQLLDKNGKPLSSIWVKTEQEQFTSPEDAHIIGAIYSLGPQDAVFDRPLKLTLTYDPQEIPEGVRQSEVYIIPYDEKTGWGSYSYKRVETEKHRVTTQVERFTRYAVLAPAKAYSPQPVIKPSLESNLVSTPLPQALSNGQPTVAEFGRGTCIPCKQMKPILEELAKEYEGKVNVLIISVDEYRDLTRQYGIMAIPTQIFFDSSGKEFNRHIGFYPKEEIVTQLQEMGVE